MEYDKLSYDVLRQQVPFLIYKRLILYEYNNIYYFNPEIPVGYVYLLRMVSFKGVYKVEEPPPSPKSSYRIEFIRSLRGRVAQNLPLPLSLMSTPGWSDAVATPSPQPADPPTTPPQYSFTDLPQLKNRIILNYLYQHRETIECRIRHYSQIPSQEIGKWWIDIVLFGYFLPEFTLDMWK